MTTTVSAAATKGCQSADESPVAATHRIVGYDLARALAILGMVIVHFALVLSRDDPYRGAVGKLVKLLDGRAAATFVVLAGVGLTLISRKAVASGDPALLAGTRRTLLRRGLFLLVAGFLNLIIWPGDILRVYGVGIMLAAFFITARPSRLLWIATAFVVGFLVLFVTVDYDTRWEWETLTYNDLWTPAGVVANLFYDGFRSVFPWAGFLFFGMWLGRHSPDWTSVRVRAFAWAVAGVAIAAHWLSSWLVRVGQQRWGMDRDTAVALLGTESMPPLPLFLVSAAGFAVTLIVASLCVADVLADNVVVRALVATGQMAFTWYVGHIVVGLGGVVALGLAGRLSLPVAVASGVGFFVAAAVVSLWWRGRVGRRGPLEWLLRRVAG